MSKSRIGFVDVAKGIAMISIILGHIHISSVNAVVYTYHVPLFLLITGYFISQKQTVLAFTEKRLRVLMAPYFVTCAAIIILAALLGLRDGSSLLQLINWSWASVYGSGNVYQTPFDILSIGAIWFLPASCFAAILFRCILQLPEKWRPLAVGALFAAGHLSSAYLFWFPMSIQAGCCCVLYLYIGWLFRQNEDRIRSLGKEVKISAVLLGILAWLIFIRNFQGIKGFYIVRNFYGEGPANMFRAILGSVCAGGIVLLISCAIDQSRTVSATFFGIMVWFYLIWFFPDFFIERIFHCKNLADSFIPIYSSFIIILTGYLIDRKTRIINRLLRFTGRYSLLVLCVHVVEHILSEYKLIRYKELLTRYMSVETYQYIMIVFKPAVVLLIVWLLLKLSPVRRLFGYERVNA